jgi:hypothetical protein
MRTEDLNEFLKLQNKVSQLEVDVMELKRLSNLKGGYITINEDEEYKKLERHHQNILDGVDDSEEVEFSKQELEDMKTITEAEIIRQRSYGFKTDAPGLLTIKSKLNKMLKDKGEE